MQVISGTVGKEEVHFEVTYWINFFIRTLLVAQTDAEAQIVFMTEMFSVPGVGIGFHTTGSQFLLIKHLVFIK